MAIAKMSRLRLIGLKKDRNAVMNVLIRSGRFQVTPTAKTGGLGYDKDTSHLDRVMGKQARVGAAIECLDALRGEATELNAQQEAELKKSKSADAVEPLFSVRKEKKSLNGRKVIGYDDFYDVAAKEYELIAVCDALDKNSFARLEEKSKITKLKAQNRTLEPFDGCPLAFSRAKDTAHAFIVIAALATAELPSSLSGYELFAETYACTRGTCAAIAGRIGDKDEVLRKLTESGASVCGFDFDCTAAEVIAQNNRKIEQCESRERELIAAGLNYLRYYADLAVLYDVMGQEIEKSNAELNFLKTRNTFVLEGWIPSDDAEKLIEAVRGKSPSIYAETSDPQEGDEPPTLVVSKKIFKPFEDVTNMYSVPSYDEKLDPNPFMAMFYFVFFGMMVGDAGYGIVLAIVCGLAMKFMRPEKGMRNLIALMFMGSFSAIIWGALFGGVFSIEGIPALWFNPMEEPVLMLVVSLLLGVIQILAGYALAAVKNFRRKKPADAVLDAVFIYTLVGGIACVAINMLLKPAGRVLSGVGAGLIVLSLAGILLTAGRHKKGFLNKLMGGFAGLYGLVNLMSDILSYARLFGLGLASGAIGYAFNILGGMLFGIPVVGYPIGILLLIPLHAFNLGIGLLGAYVHNARLQFLEFYGKFYDGGGTLFAPMGEKTKYVRFA